MTEDINLMFSVDALIFLRVVLSQPRRHVTEETVKLNQWHSGRVWMNNHTMHHRTNSTKTGNMQLKCSKEWNWKRTHHFMGTTLKFKTHPELKSTDYTQRWWTRVFFCVFWFQELNKWRFMSHLCQSNRHQIRSIIHDLFCRPNNNNNTRPKIISEGRSSTPLHLNYHLSSQHFKNDTKDFGTSLLCFSLIKKYSWDHNVSNT